MPKQLLTCLLLVNLIAGNAQETTTLTVEKIMRDPKWIGTSPSNTQWSVDGKRLFFNWNPDGSPSDSLYYIETGSVTPIKASETMKREAIFANRITYNIDRSAYVYSRDGDVYYVEARTHKFRRITQTTEMESNPQFSFNQSRVVYSRNQNLYSWDIASGETMQLTNTRSGDANSRATTSTAKAGSVQEEWLKRDQLQYFDVLRSRKEKRELADAYTKENKPKELRSIPIEDKTLFGLTISPDGRFISFVLFKPATGSKTTIVPSYVTESGFTTDLSARTKVGGPQGTQEYFIYDRVRDSLFSIKTDSIPGIQDLPDYLTDYPSQLEERKKKNEKRSVSYSSMRWSPKGTYAVLDITSDDNKDRWLMQWDTATYQLRLLDRQRDEAWIGGPGIFGSEGWIDENTWWFQSESTGYSHLYTFNIKTCERRALTNGKYEVQDAILSNDKKSFFITTNEVHPGEAQFYRLRISDGRQERITGMIGSNQVTISPDESSIAIIHSYSNKPWELYLMANKNGAKVQQITQKAQSEEFKKYPWRDPELISFPASDGAIIYARLYKPTNPAPGKPAVLFVHGAGYLQNAHKWWSTYYREYMFNNLLADKGYYVMDIDYRGSSGYGRDWRTGIYRYMGGKDLTDNVDAVSYLIRNFGVSPSRVGLYGGSYGGFIALMGLFTKPDVFAAGAALRPVTDWANYNHGYTSNILNEPTQDSIAYRRSSPFYFAPGLKGHLLMCHGMVDVNVHYQDAVKLAQRLIELGKDNWELASYPMEDHGFVEPSSWTDEYKRILKLFETVLKN